MLAAIRSNVILLFSTFAIGSILYPASMLLIGQVVFPTQANGSLSTDANGRVIGSRLIGQSFTQPEWFHPRPSAVQYNASASGASNWGASNPKLRERVEAQLQQLPQDVNSIPADAVSASGSGLDPHITVANALLQRDRIIHAWERKSGRDPATIRSMIDQLIAEHSFRPLFGLTNDVPLLNVLELNLALQNRLGTP